MDAEVIIRDFRQEADQALIYSTWCFGLFYGNRKQSPLTKKEFFVAQSAYIRPLLLQAEINIACLSDDPETILGYSVVYKNCLEWVFVKERLRRQGIAKLLLKNQNPMYVDQMTQLGKLLADKYGLKEKEHEQRAPAGLSGDEPDIKKDH